MTGLKTVARKGAMGSLLLATAATGCVMETEGTEELELAGAEQQMAWTSNDAPSIFASDLVYQLDELPREGAAETAPWAGNYWPVYQDSINYRWNGADTQSPAAKYGAAFNVEGVEDAVSRSNGIDSQSRAKVCTSTSECDAELGEECSKRVGQESGRCVATWFGICHAWAPIAIMYKEPKHEVVRNGVTFKIQDIKALLTLAHDTGLRTKFASGRCNANDGAGGIEYDEYGRPKPGQCIDTNPASYHLLLANYLGLRKQGFVEDRTYDYQVWNQPIRAFKVTKLEEIDAQEANRLVGVGPEGGTTAQESATVASSAWHHFAPYTVAAGSSFRAALSGPEGSDVDLYVRFGAQPTASQYSCRPYEGDSSETCELTVPAGETQVFVSVRGYRSEAAVTLDVNHGGAVPAAYRFNDRAVKFYEVRSEVQYIAESPASRDGNLGDIIDRYTHTDRYTYVLEADAEGRLIGGEWTGASKKAHPDFVWLPLEVTPHTIAGGKIKLNEVMSLYYDSVREGPETVVNETGSVARREWKHYGPYEVPAGAQVRVAMTGSGDADLYVKKGSQPTTRSYDCRPYANGSAESCDVAQTTAGPVFVSVYGYAASEFALEIRY
jgi:hypothetical protein